MALNSLFNQKRNSMNEADRRRQENQKKGNIEQEDMRPNRSANSSPMTYLPN